MTKEVDSHPKEEEKVEFQVVINSPVQSQASHQPVEVPQENEESKEQTNFSRADSSSSESSESSESVDEISAVSNVDKSASNKTSNEQKSLKINSNVQSSMNSKSDIGEEQNLQNQRNPVKGDPNSQLYLTPDSERHNQEGRTGGLSIIKSAERRLPVSVATGSNDTDEIDGRMVKQQYLKSAFKAIDEERSSFSESIAQEQPLHLTDPTKQKGKFIVFD